MEARVFIFTKALLEHKVEGCHIAAQADTAACSLKSIYLQDGVPRGGYNGVVIVPWGKCRLIFSQAPDFVAPEKTFETVRVDQSGAIIRSRKHKSKLPS